jgi:hypothetical protein
MKTLLPLVALLLHFFSVFWLKVWARTTAYNFGISQGRPYHPGFLETNFQDETPTLLSQFAIHLFFFGKIDPMMGDLYQRNSQA